MSVRKFAGVVGVVLIIVAATGLLWGLTLSEPGLLGSSRTVDCGSALRIEPMDGSSKLGGKYAEQLTDKCADEALLRRAIFWPMAGIGVLVVAGAVLIRPKQSPALSPSPQT
ncbi:hypothetical protein [Nocardia fluminea]|uniref:Transmembrane protein n=1 Tax=Nocardia fluminea TaxID=134984 RepID=A0A2N3VH39_9NOCA|nr:hypothetical protein [Nocardia fluminea]PKV80931.1 hypothetical protein ATK86_5368 [Nocardia fluminea]